MRLATFVPPGGGTALAGEVRDRHVTAFPDGTSVLSVPSADDGVSANGATWDLGEVTMLAPIPRPRVIFAVGLNYTDHAGEADAEIPGRPLVFLTSRLR